MKGDLNKLSPVLCGVVNARLKHPDMNHEDNAEYKALLATLCAKIKELFPVVIDWNKAAISQEDDETVTAFLYRLRAALVAYGGLTPEQAEGKRDDKYTVQIAWAFMKGLRPEISAIVEKGFLTWRNACLDDIASHAKGAVQTVKMEKEKKAEKKERATAKNIMASLAAIQTHQMKKDMNKGKREDDRDRNPRRRRWQNRGRGRGHGNSGGDRCFLCRKRGHWACDCPKDKDEGDNSD